MYDGVHIVRHFYYLKHHVTVSVTTRLHPNLSSFTPTEGYTPLVPGEPTAAGQLQLASALLPMAPASHGPCLRSVVGNILGHSHQVPSKGS